MSETTIKTTMNDELSQSILIERGDLCLQICYNRCEDDEANEFSPWQAIGVQGSGDGKLTPKQMLELQSLSADMELSQAAQMLANTNMDNIQTRAADLIMDKLATIAATEGVNRETETTYEEIINDGKSEIMFGLNS